MDSLDTTFLKGLNAPINGYFYAGDPVRSNGESISDFTYQEGDFFKSPAVDNSEINILSDFAILSATSLEKNNSQGIFGIIGKDIATIDSQTVTVSATTAFNLLLDRNVSGKDMHFTEESQHAAGNNNYKGRRHYSAGITNNIVVVSGRSASDTNNEAFDFASNENLFNEASSDTPTDNQNLFSNFAVNDFMPNDNSNVNGQLRTQDNNEYYLMLPLQSASHDFGIHSKMGRDF